MLRAFGALPTEARAREMTHRDYLWCALNLALDREEELAQMCPQCRREAEGERCPVCGRDMAATGWNQSFDPARFEAMKEGGG